MLISGPQPTITFSLETLNLKQIRFKKLGPEQRFIKDFLQYKPSSVNIVRGDLKQTLFTNCPYCTTKMGVWWVQTLSESCSVLDLDRFVFGLSKQTLFTRQNTHFTNNNKMNTVIKFFNWWNGVQNNSKTENLRTEEEEQTIRWNVYSGNTCWAEIIMIQSGMCGLNMFCKERKRGKKTIII